MVGHENSQEHNIIKAWSLSARNQVNQRHKDEQEFAKQVNYFVFENKS
jgi:hypothetical protein